MSSHVPIAKKPTGFHAVIHWASAGVLCGLFLHLPKHTAFYMVEELLWIKTTPVTQHTSTCRPILSPKMHEHNIVFEATNTYEAAEFTYPCAVIVVQYMAISARLEHQVFCKVLPTWVKTILLVTKICFPNWFFWTDGPKLL